MTGMRAVTGGLDVVGQTPPQAIVRQRTPRLLRRVRRRHSDAVIELVHWAYGAAGGAAFALLPERLRRPPWSGVGYGLAVWLGFELGLAPALDLHRPRGRKVRERLAFAADHALYGLVLSEIRPAHRARRSTF